MNPVNRVYAILLKNEYEKAQGKGTYDRGVLTNTLSSWDDFKREIGRFRNHPDYVWRGQERHGPGWELKSTFDRQDGIGDREKVLEAHKERFEKAMMGRRGPNPASLKEDDLWALGQHNALRTPLLDWTVSPFVASYFAFYQKRRDPGLRVVYALNRDIVRWFETSPMRPLVVFPDITAHENPRFLSQGGVFTKALQGESIKVWVQTCYNEENNHNRIILVELLVHDSVRQECLTDLNWMNINHASLFPDIYGAAGYCNWQLESDIGTERPDKTGTVT